MQEQQIQSNNEWKKKITTTVNFGARINNAYAVFLIIKINANCKMIYLIIPRLFWRSENDYLQNQG